MDLACDGSLLLPDLAPCLSAGSQRGLGEASRDLLQGWDPAGTAKGETWPPGPPSLRGDGLEVGGVGRPAGWPLWGACLGGFGVPPSLSWAFSVPRGMGHLRGCRGRVSAERRKKPPGESLGPVAGSPALSSASESP